MVGSGQSGCQIAEELYQRGRTVFLSTGRAGRAPRRYRGKDVMAWLDAIGYFTMTANQLPSAQAKFAAVPHVSGTNGGHTLDLHRFARDGVTLLGHLCGAAGDTVAIEPDLHANLAFADAFERKAVEMIDTYIATNHLDAPIETLPQLRDGYAQLLHRELDLAAAGISTVIWATGYRFDFSLVKLPVFDPDGFPIQTHGVTGVRGVYFVGLPWMPSPRSGTLAGVGESAAHIVSHIVDAAGER